MRRRRRRWRWTNTADGGNHDDACDIAPSPAKGNWRQLEAAAQAVASAHDERRVGIYCQQQERGHRNNSRHLLFNLTLASILLLSFFHQSLILLSICAHSKANNALGEEASALPSHAKGNDNAYEQEEELQIIGSSSHDLSRLNLGGAANAKYQRQQQGSVPSKFGRKRATNGDGLGDDLSSPSEANDPFAFTFADYLREASRTHQEDRHYSASTNEAKMSAASNDAELRNEIPTGQGGNPAQEGNRRSPVVEISDDSEPTLTMTTDPERPVSDSNVDYIFPSSASNTTTTNEGERRDGNQVGVANNKGTTAASELVNEIKLLFAWRSLPTNKCSKDCGRGFRLNHLSCIDLKFNVRVEDDLCERAQLVKPSEINGDEPCNEHDCQPQWSFIEFKQCDDARASSGCKPSVYKRIECVQVDARGETRHLDESMCTKSGPPPAPTGAPVGAKRDERQQQEATRPNRTSQAGGSSYEFSIDLSEQFDKERNEILQSSDHYRGSTENNRWQSGTSGKHSPNHHFAHPNEPLHQNAPPLNGEPFYQPSDWSECSGAPCGQLGSRVRNLTCRLYLARSAKSVTLAQSSCQALAIPEPHREEPCYMDCGSGDGADSATVAPAHVSRSEALESKKEAARQDKQENTGFELDDENDHELVYHLDEAQRFKWRHEGWTKCSAECLGGKSESLLECWDKVAEQAVDSSLCEHLKRPKALVQTCNEIPCAPEWRLEPFGNCSRACGSAGIRTRSVACVQLVPLQTGHSSYMLVSNDLCIQSAGDRGQVPHTIEPCNRLDCPPEWSVGPWSECRAGCGGAPGLRNRTVICVQEFASREGPATHNKSHHQDILEAISHSAKHWHPGKATQVPSSECFEEYKSVPALSERCQSSGDKCIGQANKEDNHEDESTARRFIDSDPTQDYRVSLDSSAGRRKTIAIKVGGRAQLPEGRNLKVRCRVMSSSLARHKHPVNARVDWFKDGVRIFAPNSTHKAVERQQIVAAAEPPLEEEDNSILNSDLLVPPSAADQLMAADEPVEVRRSRLARKLRVRSSTLGGAGGGGGLHFQFVPRIDGRFSLVKENTLRIKRLKLDDSGVYTCSVGQLSESLDLAVVGKRQQQQASSAPVGDANNY